MSALVGQGREDDETLAVEDTQPLDARLPAHGAHHLVDVVLAVLQHGVPSTAPQGVAQAKGTLDGLVLQIGGVQPHHGPGEQAQSHERDHRDQREEPHAQARKHR
jgi:hypothetical protein